MEKRKSSILLKQIYDLIKKNPGITMSQLERKTGTNPNSLKEHCEILEYFGKIKIEKTDKTRKLFILR